MKLEDPTFSFESQYEPIPLEEMEEALLVWAGTGLTGLCLADLPPETGIDLLCQWTGRTWPSACNNHGTELFFTNDKGLYHVNVKHMLPKKHELDMFFRMGREERMERILELYRESLVKLEDGRAELPDRMPGLFEFNQWNTNKPGTSVFIRGNGRDRGVYQPAAPLLQPYVRVHYNRRPHRQARGRAKMDRQGQAQG